MPTPSTIQLHDLRFRRFIPAASIQERVRELGRSIAARHAGNHPLFLAILNGAFVFTADLMRACAIPSEVDFMRLSSYDGTASTGQVIQHLDVVQNLEGRHLIIVEDIIDSGRTMAHLLPQLQVQQPASLEVATLLLKPGALQHELPIHYLGFEIPDAFVVGYGLDYHGLGRHLPDLYQLDDQS
jgi:hypoxanthine phosphoribosyltransferase